MSLVGIRYGAQELTFAQARQLSAAGSLPFPLPLLAALEDQRNDGTPTASVLGGCLRQFQLKRQVDYYEKPADMLPALFGTAFHSLMEKYTEVDEAFIQDGVLAPRHRELRLLAIVDLGLTGYEAVRVKGQCDYLHEGVLVRDWKTKKYIPNGFQPTQENIRQVNVYNWLAAEAGYLPAPTWGLDYVSQERVERFTGPTYDLGQVGTWVKRRLHEWALHESQGILVDPLPELFMDANPRTHKLPFPCGYCPVRDACLAAVRAESPPPF